MFNRWLNIAIFACWATSVGWLVIQKILPTLLVGEPPSFRTIIENQSEAPVGWRVLLNERRVGWAAAQTLEHEKGVHELRTRIHLAELDFAEFVPPLIASLLGGESQLSQWRIPVDATSRLLVDPLGRPYSVQSKLIVGQQSTITADGSEATTEVYKITIIGNVAGNDLVLAVKSIIGGRHIDNEARCHLPPGALLGDAVSPQSFLPGLRLGQTWTMPVYSPFRPATNPTEVLEAAVEKDELLDWGGRQVATKVVVYRAVKGSQLSSAADEKGRVWVGEDGTVLRQEVRLLSARLAFERLAEGELEPDMPTQISELFAEGR